MLIAYSVRGAAKQLAGYIAELESATFDALSTGMKISIPLAISGANTARKNCAHYGYLDFEAPLLLPLSGPPCSSRFMVSHPRSLGFPCWVIAIAAGRIALSIGAISESWTAE